MTHVCIPFRLFLECINSILTKLGQFLLQLLECIVSGKNIFVTNKIGPSVKLV